MRKRIPRNYTYRVGHGIANSLMRYERAHKRVRPGGNLVVNGRAISKTGALQTQNRRIKTRSYYD